MDQQKTDAFIEANQNKFPAEKLGAVKEKLASLPDEKYDELSFKDPTVVLILAIFLGGLGVDRFMIGDIGLGVLKLITYGGCGIWSIIDWFITFKKAKEINLNQVMALN